MKEQWYEVKRWYQVTAPDGYLCLELAYTPYDACRRAAESRPGYAPAEACRAVLHEPAGNSGNWDALGKNVREIKERLSC